MKWKFSYPVSISSLLGAWNTIPILERTFAGSSTISYPFTVALPEDGFNSVASICIVVVLPAPLEPSSPKLRFH